MKVFLITHLTRGDGLGILNGLIFKDYISARAEVDDWIEDHINPSYIENFWHNRNEFCGEDDCIEIVEQELH